MRPVSWGLGGGSGRLFSRNADLLQASFDSGRRWESHGAPMVVKPHSLLCSWRQSREQEAPFLKYLPALLGCAGRSGFGLLWTADLLRWNVHPPGKIWTVSHSRQQARAWLCVLGTAGSALSQGSVTCALRTRGSAPPSLLPIFKAASFSNSHRQDHAYQTKGREPCRRRSLWKRMLYLH